MTATLTITRPYIRGVANTTFSHPHPCALAALALAYRLAQDARTRCVCVTAAGRVLMLHEREGTRP